MKRVAVFGNAGGGKTTLARHLAELTRLTLYTVDMMQFRAGGAAVPPEEYLKTHGALLRQEESIIDGYGGVAPAWQRFAKADALIFIDLPLVIYGWRVTKRLIKGLFSAPVGWPEGSPLWRSTMNSYRVLWPCHRRLTPEYRQLAAAAAASKRVHHLRSAAETSAFLEAVEHEYANT